MKTILIVDDNKYLRDALSLTIKTLFPKKNRVVHAKDGIEAAEILDAAPVDLMLTDIQMPVMDGYELIEYRNRRHPSVAVIVMTADTSPDVLDKLHSLGISECLEKPFHHDSITRMVEMKLETPHRTAKHVPSAAHPCPTASLPAGSV